MLVKSVHFLPASIKSIKLMQKYSHITKLFACTRKMFAFMFLFPMNIFNFFRNMLNTKTIEKKQFHFCYKIKQPNVCLRLHIHQGLWRMLALSFIFLGRLFLQWTPLNLHFHNTSVFQNLFGGIKNPILFHNRSLQFLFLFCFQNQLLQSFFLLTCFLTN